MKFEEIEILVKYRIEQAREALDDAKYLIDGKRSSQSIVNRAYYAMFYAALALLQSISKTPSKHSGVISIFDKEFVMKGIFEKELSKDFHKAFEMRQKTDYQVIKPTTHDKATELCYRADNFVNKVQDYLLYRKK